MTTDGELSLKIKIYSVIACIIVWAIGIFTMYHFSIVDINIPMFILGLVITGYSTFWFFGTVFQ